MTNEILQQDHPQLRTVSRTVRQEEIGGEYLTGVIRRLKQAMNEEKDSAAIAAPQIGENIRVFIISEKILPEMIEEDRVFINPQITKRSKRKIKAEEGCLSLRWLYGDVERHEKVTVHALDETGKPVTYGGSGLVAQAFQHEVDHLDGILFTDKAENVRDLPPQQQSTEDHERIL